MQHIEPQRPKVRNDKRYPEPMGSHLLPVFSSSIRLCRNLSQENRYLRIRYKESVIEGSYIGDVDVSTLGKAGVIGRRARGNRQGLQSNDPPNSAGGHRMCLDMPSWMISSPGIAITFDLDLGDRLLNIW